MKCNFLFLASLVLFLAFNTFAKCNSSGIEFYPKKKVIFTNSNFIIEGYGSTTSLILSFENRPLYLINDKSNEKIKLELVNIYTGAKNINQAIFKPEQNLKPNEKYFLKIENLTEKELKLIRSKGELIYWLTRKSNNVDFENFDIDINYFGNEYTEYGCGPAVSATFKITKNYSIETWFKTELKDLSDNSLQTYILTNASNFIDVGHGMCSGPFQFGQSGNYKVRFTPMLSNGNFLQDEGWSTFSNPYQKKGKNTFETSEWTTFKNPYQKNEKNLKSLYLSIVSLVVLLLIILVVKILRK